MGKILLPETASVDTPGNGYAAVYVNGDGVLSWKNDAGTVSAIGAYTAPTSYAPTVDGATGSPTVTYTTQLGRYQALGGIVWFGANIVINTISGGTGALLVSLPPVAAASSYLGLGVLEVLLRNVDIPASAVSLVGRTSTTTTARISAILDNADYDDVLVTGLAAGDTIRVSGWYFTA